MKRKPKVEPWSPRFTYQSNGYIQGIVYDEKRKRHIRSLGTTNMAEATDAMAKIIKQLRGGQVGSKTTLSDAIKRITPEWRKHSDYRKKKIHCRMLLEYFGDKKSLDDISGIEIADYIDYLREDQENSNATINRKLAVLKRLLNVAMKNWEVIHHVPYIPTFKEVKGGHREFVEPHEMEAILKANSGLKYQRALKILYETGLRPKELITLRREDVRLPEGYLRLRDTKNGESWITPITDEAYEPIAEAYLAQENSEFLMDISYNGLRTAWNIGRKCVMKENVPGFTIYALRHTFARRLLRAGFSTAEVKKWLHHKTIQTTESYVQLEDKELLKIRDKFNANSGSQNLSVNLSVNC